MKKLLTLIVLLVIFTSCTKITNASSGCSTESLYYNNSSDWSKLLHCKDTVYMFGPKGTIEKYPTNNK